MTPRNKIKFALFANIILLSIVCFLMFQYATESPYFRFGPNDKFILVAVKIDTWSKYGVVILIISFIEFTKVMIEDLGTPILVFNIYNPDKDIITDFSKNELQIYGNMMFLVNNLRYVFQVLVTVTQIDIAVFAVLISQITGIITVRFLLNEKKFSSQLDASILKNDLNDSNEIIDMDIDDTDYLMKELIDT